MKPHAWRPPWGLSICILMQDMLVVHRARCLPDCVLQDEGDTRKVPAKGRTFGYAISQMVRCSCGAFLPPSCPVAFLWRLVALCH